MLDPKRDTAPWFVVALVIGAVLAYLTYFFSLELPNSGAIGERVSRLDVWRVSVGWSNLPVPVAGAMKKLVQVEWVGQRHLIVILSVLLFAASVAIGQLLLWFVGLAGARESAERSELASSAPSQDTDGKLTGAERLVFAYGLGISALSLATLGLGLAGWMNRTAVLVSLTAVCCLSVLWETRQRKAKSPAHGEPDPHSVGSILAPRSSIPTRGRLIAKVSGVVAMVLFLAISFLGAMLPATDFDVREYHLQAPKEFFLAGRIQFLPHNVYANMAFGTEMISLLGMVVAGDWWWGALVGQTVLATFAPMTALGVCSLGRRLFCREAGWFAALIYLTTPWVYRVSIIPYTENALCFFLLAGTLAAACAFQQTRRSVTIRLWWVAGALAGSAAACKYPALISTVFPLGAAAIAWSLLARFSPSPPLPLSPSATRPTTNHSLNRLLLQSLVPFALGVLIAFGPWLAKNWAMTGNPTYPLLYGVFGGRNWTPEKNAKWEWGHRVSLLVALGLQRPPDGQVHHPDDPQISLSLRRLKENVIDVTAQADWQSPLVFGLAPLALLCAAKRRAALCLWLFVAYLFFQWWLLTHRLDRFWVPLLPVAAVLAGAGAVWDSGRVWRVTAAAIVACTVFFNLSFSTTPLCGDNRYSAPLVPYRDPIDGTANWMNDNLPFDAKVLAVGAADLFHLDRPVVYNTVFDDCIFEQWVRDRDMAAENLKRHGITHVYVNWREIGRYRAPGSYGYTDFVQPEVFRELVDAGVLQRIQAFGARVQDESEREPASELFVVIAGSAQ